MKQENRFVAQLFHYIAPFVDMERDLFICVDGGAANAHAGREDSPLLDPAVPDLWLSLVGKQCCFGIEAKVLEGNSISIRQSQIVAWRSEGNGHYKPKFWVATNRKLTEFWCWHHATLLPCLDGTKSKTANVSLSVARFPAEYHSDSLAGLALYLLANG